MSKQSAYHEVEREVLGGVLLNDENIEKYKIDKNLFVHKPHQVIFEHVVKYRCIDFETLKHDHQVIAFDIMRTNKFLGKNYGEYCKILRKYRLEEKVRNILDDGSINADEKLQLINKITVDVQEENIRIYHDIADYFHNEYLTSGNFGMENKVKFDVPWLDKALKFKPGSTNFIGGRPGSGKTALACQLINHAQEPVYFFSLEMAAEAIYSRLLANKTGILWTAILDGAKKNIEEAKAKAPNYRPNVVIDETSRSIEAICYAIRENCNSHRLFIIDHLKLIRNNLTANSSWEKLTDTLQQLKNIARECNVSILCLNQMSRDVEKHKRNPSMADLAGTSAVEENADWILLIWADELFSLPDGKKNIRLRIAKNRYGVADDCPKQVWLDGICQRFSEMEMHNPEPENKKTYVRGEL